MTQIAAKLRQSGLLVLIGTSVVGASVLISELAPDWTWSHHPFHAVLEGFGAFAALAVALLLLLLRRLGQLEPVHVWLASGLVGMGVLDGLHGASHAGGSFVWLHAVATIAGGVLFACVLAA